jgi:hypothetical protein
VPFPLCSASGDGVVVSGGMARRSTRHEPAWGVGNGRGMECGRGPSAFFGRDADRQGISALHGNRSLAPPDARSCKVSERDRAGAFPLVPIMPAAMPAGSAPAPASTNTRCAILQSCEAREAGAIPQRACEGDGLRDRSSGEAGTVGCGALRKTMGFLKKILMAPCRASIRLSFPTSSGKRRAPRHCRRVGDTVSRVVSSPGFPAMRNQIHGEPCSEHSA